MGTYGEGQNKPELQHQDRLEFIRGEVSENHVLVRMDYETLKDRARIEWDVLEPLLGGEFKDELLEKALRNPGDSVTLKGSTVLNLIYGQYVYNTQTGYAAESYRSDIDVMVSDPEVLERLIESGFAVENTYAATKAKVGETQVDIISTETMKNMDIEAMNDIEAWADTLEDPELQAYLKHNANYFKQALQGATERQLLSLHSLFGYEAIGIKIERDENGELQASLEDPTWIVTDDVLVKQQIKLNRANGLAGGFQVTIYNEPSVRSFMLEAFRHMETPSTGADDGENKTNSTFHSSTKVPLYTLDGYSRMLRTACELNVGVYWNPLDPICFYNPDSYRMYSTLYKVAQKIDQEGIMFEVDDKVLQKDSGETRTAEEWYKEKMQTAFARSCVADPMQAFNRTFACLPLGRTIAEPVADTFDKYHETVTPNTLLPDLIDIYGVDTLLGKSDRNAPEGLKQAAYALVGNKEALEAKPMRTIDRLNILYLRYYGEDLLLTSRLDQVQRNETDENLDDDEYFEKAMLENAGSHGKDTIAALRNDWIKQHGLPEGVFGTVTMKHYPEGMSEIMAMIFVANEMDPDEGREKIKQVVDNWIPSGILKGEWKKDVYEFEMGLDEEKIVKRMKEIKADIGAKPL
ncbi:hypothetical protein JXA34_00055 [Patescibacteria group bacterium]|nr:hypothetical protein [Patescibacteria group bacterium]